MNFYAMAIAMAIVVMAWLVSALVKRAWVRSVISIFLFICIAFSATFGMGGLRTYIEGARKEGKSDDYIAGFVERHYLIGPARLQIVIYSAGLVVLTLAGWIGSPFRARNSEVRTPRRTHGDADGES